MQLPKLSLPDKTSRKMLTELPLFSSFAALRCLICVRNWNSQNSSESSEVYMRWSDFCKILRENCKDISQITTKLLQLQRFLTLSKSADGQTNLERSQFISHKKNIWYYSRFPTQKNNSSWLIVSHSVFTMDETLRFFRSMTLSFLPFRRSSDREKSVGTRSPSEDVNLCMEGSPQQWVSPKNHRKYMGLPMEK